nr:5422_t:CDS:2 [Entrophospora candida]CAG8504245.1 15219_t:CDS:2 [Entrophospora candida]
MTQEKRKKNSIDQEDRKIKRKKQVLNAQKAYKRRKEEYTEKMEELNKKYEEKIKELEEIKEQILNRQNDNQCMKKKELGMIFNYWQKKATEQKKEKERKEQEELNELFKIFEGNNQWRDTLITYNEIPDREKIYEMQDYEIQDKEFLGYLE